MFKDCKKCDLIYSTERYRISRAESGQCCPEMDWEEMFQTELSSPKQLDQLTPPKSYDSPFPLKVKKWKQVQGFRRNSCGGTTREATFGANCNMFLKWNSNQGYPKCVLLMRSSIDDTRIESSFLPLAKYILGVSF